jgi:hypothetical protein
MNSINFCSSPFLLFHRHRRGPTADISRLDKSPLLANGYNAPPTHLNHMPFMQMGHHGAPMMSPGMPPHIRPDAAMMENHQSMPGMEAITRQIENKLCCFYIKSLTN